MNQPNFTTLIAKLEEIGVRRDNVVLLGSVPLVIRGLRDVNDLDVLTIRGMVADLATKHPELEVKDLGMGRGLAANLPVGESMIQFSETIHNFAAGIVTTEEVWQTAESWEGWNVLSKDLCIRVKRALGRAKDLDDLQLLGV